MKEFSQEGIFLAFLFLQIERIRAVPSVRWFLSLPLTAAFDKIISRIFSFCMGKLLYLYEAYDDLRQGDRMKKSGEFVENNISQEAIVKRASETLSF